MQKEYWAFGDKFRFNSYGEMEEFYEAYFQQFRDGKKKTKVIGLVLYVFDKPV